MLDFGNGLLVLDDLSGAINEAAVSGDVNVEKSRTASRIWPGRWCSTSSTSIRSPWRSAIPLSCSRPETLAGVPVQPEIAMPFTADLDLTTAGSLAAGRFRQPR